jgi:hypothetical protein
MANKLKLTVVKPTAEGIATLVERLTGTKPDLQKIKDKLAKHAAKSKA